MNHLFERLSPVLTFLVVSFYVWVYFFEMPHLGFRYTHEGEIIQITVAADQASGLRVWDRIRQVGAVQWTEFEQDLTYQIFPHQKPLAPIPLQIERGDQTISILWTPPESEANDRMERLNSQWWLSYIFVLAGTFIAFFVRPRDTTWKLLLAFNFLTAVWMAVGSGPSQAHMEGSALVLRSLTWIMVPVYWHLHWNFPHSFGNLPKPLLWSMYLLAFGLALIQWFQILPSTAFSLGFLAAAGGSLLLLLIKYFLKKEQRASLRFLGASIGVIFIPVLLIMIGDFVLGQPVHAFVYGGALLAFPALPGSYFFVAYRRQLHQLSSRIVRLSWFYLGLVFIASLMIVMLARIQFAPGPAVDDAILFGALSALMTLIISAAVVLPFLALPALSGAIYSSHKAEGSLEIRANRLFVGYMFFVLIALALVTGIALSEFWLSFPGSVFVIGSGAGLLAAWVTAYGYAPFRRLVEKRLLGLPSVPVGLVEAYAARISTTLDRVGLARLHQDEILPAMLIRQAALLFWNGAGQLESLYTAGISPEELPSEAQSQHLLSNTIWTEVIASEGNLLHEIQWAKVVLPLELAHQRLGLWLLGRRDPDDLYTRSEIPVLQALSGQTAIALANLIQAEELRKLYQRNIEHQEAERMALARELHDDVLNQLAILSMNIASGSTVEELTETYEEVTRRLRGVVENLRPALLIYGLHPALEELVYGYQARPHAPNIMLEIPHSPVRYASGVEVHLFRIVQQACENALRHAQAQTIWIRGTLSEAQVWMSVSDDGTGFDPDDIHKKEHLAKKHFGLAGIRERAALIGARLKVESRTGKGTHISIEWRTEASDL